MKHVHAELLRKLADNKDLMVQSRAKCYAGDPSKWVRAVGAVHVAWLDDVDFRDADDWRNKFRDAAERGEVVEHFNGREWGGPPGGMKWIYGNLPETYRIKPKVDPYQVFRDAIKNGFDVQYRLTSSELRYEPPGTPAWVSTQYIYERIDVDRYRIRAKPAKPILNLDVVEECLITLYRGGGGINRDILRRALDALQKHREAGK